MRRYDLTFLTAADFPWVDDGYRNSDEVRQRMQRRFEDEVARLPEPVVELRGSLDERTRTAVVAIEHILGLPCEQLPETIALRPRAGTRASIQ